jgi:hypothetical protein
MPTERIIDRHSKLYDRYNGFMLGASFASAYSRGRARSYSSIRGRMQEFLEEMEIELLLPFDQVSFTRAHGALAAELAPALKAAGGELFDFFLLGSCSIQRCGLDDTEILAEVRRVARHILASHDLSRDIWDTSFEKLETGAQPLQRAMPLLAATIEPLEKEPSTCFVAQPPGDLAARNFQRFFRVMLEACGRHVLRTWAGFGGERRQEVMVRVIQRSGSLLADLSDYGPNVIFKLGVARGAGRRVYLFTSTPGQDPPIDLALRWVCTFAPSGAHWIPRALSEGIYFISAVDAVLDSDRGSLGAVAPEVVIGKLEQAEAFAAEGLE